MRFDVSENTVVEFNFLMSCLDRKLDDWNWGIKRRGNRVWLVLSEPSVKVVKEGEVNGNGSLY